MTKYSQREECSHYVLIVNLSLDVPIKRGFDMTKECMKEVYPQLYAIGYVYWLKKVTKKCNFFIVDTFYTHHCWFTTHGWITFEEKN